MLAEFDGADDDGSLAAVGGVGGEGSIEFELDQHFVRRRGFAGRIRNRRGG